MEMWEQATKLHLDGKLDEAEKLYDDLLTQNPENPGLLATLGTLCIQLNRMGLAITLLTNAVKLMKSKGVRVPSDIYSNLGLAYKYSGQPEKAVPIMEKGVSSDPTPESITVLGAMFVEVGQAEKCIEINRRALAMNPDYGLAHWNMACAMLELGDWGHAWDEYEWGLLPKVKARIDRKLGGFPRWDGKAPGKVCIYGEQGIGDEIMFASMIPEVMKTNEVVIETHRRLKTLFEKSFLVNCYGTREDTEIHWPENFDYQISCASLGQYYRRTKESFPGMPYLVADTAPRGNKFRIGISWTGGVKSGRVLKRTVPLSWWKDILDQDCEFISLQYTDCDEEIRLAETELGVEIKQFPCVTDKDSDYEETAKLVMSCDLVISVCTSVIHLAGAMGVPCWVMTPAWPAWRYQSSGPIPWYRSVRLYRQPTNDVNSWIPVIGRVAQDLTGLLKERKVA